MEHETTTSVIIAPDGTPATIPTILLTDEEARLLRIYKKFLNGAQLREALYCDTRFLP